MKILIIACLIFFALPAFANSSTITSMPLSFSVSEGTSYEKYLDVSISPLSHNTWRVNVIVTPQIRNAISDCLSKGAQCSLVNLSKDFDLGIATMADLNSLSDYPISSLSENLQVLKQKINYMDGNFSFDIVMGKDAKPGETIKLGFHSINITTAYAIDGGKQNTMVKTSDGTLWIVLLTGTNLTLYNSSTNGTSWNLVRIVNDEGVIVDQTYYAQMAANASDTLGISYLGTFGGTRAMFFRTYNTKTFAWGTPIFLSNNTNDQLSMAMNGTGQLFIAHVKAGTTGQPIHINYSIGDWSTWSGVAIPRTEKTYILDLKIDQANNLHLVAVNKSITTATYDYLYFNSTTGTTWSAPLMINTPSPSDYYGMSGMIDDKFVYHIVFTDNKNDPGPANPKLYYANKSSDSPTFTIPLNITSNATMSGLHPSIMLTSQNMLHLFFTDTGGYTNNNVTYYMAKTNAPINWTAPAVIDQKSAFIYPRGSQFLGLNNYSIMTSSIDYYEVNVTGGNFAYGNKSFTTPDGVSMNYVSPTLSDGATHIFNFLYVNVSLLVSGTADKCVLQWNGANESMSMDATKTFCYANKTALADATYVFNVFSNTTTNATNSVGTRTNYVNTSDVTAPLINVLIPQNNTEYSTSQIQLNFTVTDSQSSVDKCWYQIDSGSITYMASCINTSFYSQLGNHLLKLYANDTVGNINHSFVNYTANYSALLTINVFYESNPTTPVMTNNFTVTNNADVFITASTTTGTVDFTDATALNDGAYQVTITSPGMTTRSYWVNIISGETYTLNAYLMNLTNGNSVVFYTKDIYNQPLEYAGIVIYRYIGGTLTRIAQLNSTTDGTASALLESSVIYVSVGTYPRMTNVSKTFATTDSSVILVFGLNQVQNYYLYLRGTMIANCIGRNSSTSRNLTCTINDTNDIMSAARLEVRYIKNASQTNEVCSQVDTTSSSQIFEVFCALPMTNGTYVWRLVGTSNFIDYMLVSNSWEFGQAPTPYGVTGILVVFMLFLVTSYIGAYNPPFSVLLGLLSIGMSWYLQLLELGPGGWASLTGIWLVGIIVAYRLHDEG